MGDVLELPLMSITRLDFDKWTYVNGLRVETIIDQAEEKPRQQVKFDRAEAAIAAIDLERAAEYERYFMQILPGSEKEIFRRGLFAFASVHTSWQSNVRLYEYLWDLKWMNSKKELYSRIVESRAGMHVGRTRHIWNFTKRYWEQPDMYRISADEDWFAYRDRLVDLVPGLGMAKAAFFSELIYFDESECTCGDTHFHQLYGAAGSKPLNKKNWHIAERHWAEKCREHGVAPTTARWMYWDKIQRQPDSRYWTYVLEGNNTKPNGRSGRQLELWGFSDRMDWYTPSYALAEANIKEQEEKAKKKEAVA